VVIEHIERITCDNPQCVSYVDELMSQEPGVYELHALVRSVAAGQGWSSGNARDLCPSHSRGNAPREE
jgi:hypothetical protein